LLGGGQSVKHEPKPNRHAYVHVTRGSVKLNGKELLEGDGAALSVEPSIKLIGVKDAVGVICRTWSAGALLFEAVGILARCKARELL
jgi:Quercetinase C-terminal cupin domain